MVIRLFILSLLYLKATACITHSSTFAKRDPAKNWNYDASFNWARVSPGMFVLLSSLKYIKILKNTNIYIKDYLTCQSGTHQSPIPLDVPSIASSKHRLSFDYGTKNTTGSLYNWGFAPAFDVATESKDNLSKNPSIRYDETTLYLKGWHIHTPAEHHIHGKRAKAEMHFVHADASGKEKAVLGFLINPNGNTDNEFFAQFQQFFGFNDTSARQTMTVDLKKALSSVSLFKNVWAYEGSLTSPPCREGIQWFVASQIMSVSVEQMKSILGASSYSARVLQDVWNHKINQ